MVADQEQRLLRVRRSDKPDDYILLHAVLNGRSELSIKLEATEGENPYFLDLNKELAYEFCEQRNGDSRIIWERLLIDTFSVSSQLGHSNPQDGHVEILANITASRLDIVFRQNIAGILHRLGVLPLQRDDDVEIDTISWAHTAVQRSDVLEAEVRSMRENCNDQNQTIQRMQKLLDDLVEAKASHEHALLSSFTELLNTKKLKIRDQQRLLGDTKPSLQIHDAAKESSEPGKAGSSKPGKRKVPMEDVEDPTHNRSSEQEETESETASESSGQGADYEDISNVDRMSVKSTSKIINDTAPDTAAGRAGTEHVPPPARTLPFEEPKKNSAKPVEGMPHMIEQTEFLEFDDNVAPSDDEL